MQRVPQFNVINTNTHPFHPTNASLGAAAVGGIIFGACIAYGVSTLFQCENEMNSCFTGRDLTLAANRVLGKDNDYRGGVESYLEAHFRDTGTRRKPEKVVYEVAGAILEICRGDSHIVTKQRVIDRAQKMYQAQMNSRAEKLSELTDADKAELSARSKEAKKALIESLHKHADAAIECLKIAFFPQLIKDQSH